MIDISVIKSSTGVKDYVSALCKPLQTNGDAMEVLNNTLVSRKHYNGQIMVLRKALGELMGFPVDILTNQQLLELLYLYSEASGIPTVYLYSEVEGPTIFFFSEAELAAYTNDPYDFKVLIPAEDADAETIRQVTAWTELYKVAGTRFIVTDDFMVAERTISSAEILTGNSAPITLVAAPGAGKIIVPIAFQVKYKFVTAGYAVNTTFDFLISTVVKATVAAMINQAADRYLDAPLVGSGVSSVNVENQPLTWKVQTGNPTTGAGSLQVKVIYKIVTVV